MPQDCTPEILQTVLAEILEEAAFSFAEPIEEPPPWGDNLVQAELSFGNDGAGVSLTTTQAYAHELACNLMGFDADAELSENERQDAVAEMLNIVCGAMMPLLFGEEALVRIGTPSVRSSNRRAINTEQMKKCASITLLADDLHPIELATYQN